MATPAKPLSTTAKIRAALASIAPIPGPTPEPPRAATARKHRPRVKAARRVDGVATQPLFAPRREVLMAIDNPRSERVSSGTFATRSGATVPGAEIEVGAGTPPLVVTSKPRTATHGPEAIISALARLNVSFEILPDGSGIVASTPGGAMTAELRSAIDEVAPLIAGHMNRAPVPCSWCDAPAVTRLLPDGYACAEHLERKPS